MNLYPKTSIPWRCSFLLLFSFFSGTDFCPSAVAADFLSSVGSYDILFHRLGKFSPGNPGAL